MLLPDQLKSQLSNRLSEINLTHRGTQESWQERQPADSRHGVSRKGLVHQGWLYTILTAASPVCWKRTVLKQSHHKQVLKSTVRAVKHMKYEQ